jgi:hypothetical protein
MDERFGTLRSLLQAAPSETVWRALCEELARWGEEERERVALPYALGHLDKWPPKIERMVDEGDPAWRQQLGNGLYKPDLEWFIEAMAHEDWPARCCHIELNSAEHYEVLCAELGRFGRLVSCELSGNEGDVGALLELLRAPWPPSLRSLELTYLREQPPGSGREIAQAIAQNETLGGLEVLDLECARIGDAGARALTQSAYLGQLRSLNISNNELSAAGARALAQSPLLAGLTALDVSYNKLGMGLVALMSSPHTRALKTLELYEVSIDEACARALRAIAWPPALEHFGLEHAKLERGALGAIAAAPGLRAVSTFGPLRADADELARFVASPHLTGLRELQVRGSADAAMIAASENPALSELESLEFKGAGLSAPCIEALSRCVFRDSLRELTVRAGSGDIVSLFESGAWPSLRKLDLSGKLKTTTQDAHEPTVSEAAVERLARCEVLRGLESLGLSANLLGDAAVMALADSGMLGSLRALNLSGNQIGDGGLIALIERGELTSLRSLNLDDNLIGDAGAIALAASRSFTSLQPPRTQHYSESGSLSFNKIGLAGARALLRSPYLDLQTGLTLYKNALTHEDIVELAADPALARLQGPLWVVAADAREETWQALIDSPYANQVTREWAALALSGVKGERRRQG